MKYEKFIHQVDVGINYFANLRMTFRQNFFLQDWFRNKFGVGLGYRVRVRIRVMVRVGEDHEFTQFPVNNIILILLTYCKSCKN